MDHVTVYRWVQTFTAEFLAAARPCRHVPGDRWFVDGTYVVVQAVCGLEAEEAVLSAAIGEPALPSTLSSAARQV